MAGVMEGLCCFSPSLFVHSPPNIRPDPPRAQLGGTRVKAAEFGLRRRGAGGRAVLLVLLIISLTLGVRVRLPHPCGCPAPPSTPHSRPLAKALGSFSQVQPSRDTAVPLLPDSNPD